MEQDKSNIERHRGEGENMGLPEKQKEQTFEEILKNELPPALTGIQLMEQSNMVNSIKKAMRKIIVQTRQEITEDCNLRKSDVYAVNYTLDKLLENIE